MRRPIIFLYSLPFPAIWVCCSLLSVELLPGKRLGTVGTALMIMGAASLISWLFVRRHGRDFSASEYLWIILYCIGWALFFECIVLVSIFSQAEAAPDFNARTLIFLVLFTVTLDSLFVWLAFRNFGRRVIKSYLAKNGKAEIYEK